MNLYIETENGITKNHPAYEDNLMQAFGAIPEHWKPFIRVERPNIGVYKVFTANKPVYQKINDVWTDVWLYRDMTAEEKTALQQTIINDFNNQPQAENWSAWTLDEATCIMVCPIPRPTPEEGKFIEWCGADNAWKEIPTKPEGNYKFDFLAWNWVAL